MPTIHSLEAFSALAQQTVVESHFSPISFFSIFGFERLLFPSPQQLFHIGSFQW